MRDNNSIAHAPSARYAGTSPSRNPRWGGGFDYATFFGGGSSS
jgi:hypothetical protein